MFYKFIFGLDRFIRDKMNQLAADHISVPVCPLVRVLAPRVNGCNYRGTGPVTPSDLIRGNVTNEGSGHGRDTGERVSRYSCLDTSYTAIVVWGFYIHLVWEKIPHRKEEPLLNISYTQVWWDSYILLCRVWCGHCVISSDGAMSGETLMMLITRGGGASQGIIGAVTRKPVPNINYRRELTTMLRLKLTGISTTNALIWIPILIFRVWNA